MSLLRSLFLTRSGLFFTGLCLSFAGASLAGLHFARSEGFDHVKRFHQRLSIDGNFFPPMEMLENTVLDRWKPGQTIVIIGGNSVMHGIGQPETELWSLHLQELLGPAYIVSNLAFRGATTYELGGLVAESLIRQGYPVVYVTNARPGGLPRSFDGHYAYLFWQALEKKRLIDTPERLADLQDWLRRIPTRERLKAEEMQRAALLTRWTKTQSLWHWLGFNVLFTVWNPVSLPHWWAPKNELTDPEPFPRPIPDRYPPGDGEMRMVRAQTDQAVQRDAAGKLSYRDNCTDGLKVDIPKIYPAAVRPHVFVVLNQNSPYYRRQLSEEERQLDSKAHAHYASAWVLNGIQAKVIGEDWLDEDFADRAHLSPSGGRKLAVALAPEIRVLAAATSSSTERSSK